MQEIIKETIYCYRRLGLFNGVKLKKIILRFPDSIVFLDNDKFAASANYDFLRLGKDKLIKLENILNQAINKNQLTFEYIFKKSSNDLLFTSLKISLLAAISQSYLNNNFLLKHNLLLVNYNKEKMLKEIKEIIQMGDRVCVVGFGGWLFDFLKNPLVEKVFCLDFFHNSQKDAFVLENLNNNYLEIGAIGKKLILGGEEKTEEFIKNSDIIFITACALTNNTMEKLLNLSKNARKIIICGHSSSLIPFSFYSRNITLFITKLFNINLNLPNNLSDDEFRKIIDRETTPVLIKKYE